MTNKTSILVMGGLFSAIYAVFFIVSIEFGGMLESSLFFLLPLPLAIFSFKYGLRNTLITLIATILLGLLINPISTIFYVLGATILGVVYGELLRKKISEKTRIFMCVLTTFIVDLFSMILFAKFLNYSLDLEIKMLFDLLLSIFKIPIHNQVIYERMVMGSIPLFLGIFSFVEGILIHLLISFVMNRLKLIKYNILTIYTYSIDKKFGYGYLIAFLAHLFTLKYFYFSDGFLYVLGMIFFVIFYLFVFAFSIEGYMCLNLYFGASRIKIIYFILLILSLLFIPLILIAIFSVLGIIFVFSEYRKRLLYNNKSL